MMAHCSSAPMHNPWWSSSKPSSFNFTSFSSSSLSCAGFAPLLVPVNPAFLPIGTPRIVVSGTTLAKAYPFVFIKLAQAILQVLRVHRRHVSFQNQRVDLRFQFG